MVQLFQLTGFQHDFSAVIGRLGALIGQRIGGNREMRPLSSGVVREEKEEKCNFTSWPTTT